MRRTVLETLDTEHVVTQGGITVLHIARGDAEETITERRVREAIQRHLGDDDVVISGLRLHDNTYGDVEVDLIVLMPNAGVGIVEVKGGTITFADGTWHQTGKEGTKEIDPAGQARRGWYSFRRFVERQPGWCRGRLRGDWFLAFPQTHVPQDEEMGPEGRRGRGRSLLAKSHAAM